MRHAVAVVHAALFVMAAVMPHPSLAAGTLEVVALDARQRIGCARNDQATFLTAKGEQGDNRTETIAGAAARIAKRLQRIDGKLDELKSRPPADGVAAAIAKLERIRGRLVATAQAVADCGSGDLFEQSSGSASFELLCRHGFHAPSVARNRECGVDLSRSLLPPSARAAVEATWDIDATAGILDELLGDACEQSGGVLLRNTNLSADAPLYSAYCGRIGRPVTTHYDDDTLVLGMEEEPTGPCIVAALLANQADDGCGDYKRPPGGGGTGTPPPPPDDDDCIIVRMEEEPTGCE